MTANTFATEDFVEDATDPAGTAASAVSAHSADTTAVHGIADTANLVLTNDARLSDARTPTVHATSHQDGGADELSLDGSQITAGTVADARIASTLARDSEVTSAVAAEATLARNADNLTSGTVADARIASTLARDSEVTSAVAAEVTARDTAIGVHSADTTSVHGITDTSVLETTSGAQAKVDTHVNDTSAAHAASAIAFTPDGSISATTVQAAIVEVRDEAGAGGAPTTVNYLVGTADGGLSNEIVVGTTPGGELGGTWASPTVDTTHSGSSHAATQAAAEATAAAALSAHLVDTSDAHDASAVSADSTTLVGTGTDVQAVLEELDNAIAADVTALSDHLADTSDAHDASAISILDTANDFTATDVEGALAELQTDHEADATALSDHISDTSAAHAASAVSANSATLVGTGTDVQAVLEELDNAIVADEGALAAHLADTSDAHDASAISFTPDGSISATDVQAAIIEVRDEAGAGGAPTTADYLVGTAQGGLSAEIVVGTTPGGELGNTWASPTVDATHSGSSHAGVQAAAEATAAAALSAHSADTTAVHGITDTADLVLDDDARLTDDRDPTAHAASHQDGGADELALDGSQITTGTVADARIASTIARDSEVAAGYQPLDTDLSAIAGLTATTDNIIQSVASAWASRTPAQLKATLALVKGDVGLGNVDNTADASKTFAGEAITSGSVAIARLPIDADVATLSLPASTTISAFGASLIDDAAASNARTTLGLGTLATQDFTNVNIGGGNVVNIQDIAVADGGTGSSTAAGARTNLGLVIGTDVQAQDADLSTIAGLTATTDNIIQSVAGAWASRTPAQVRTALGIVDGWLPDANTWVYGSATSFGIAADATVYLSKGTKVSYNDGAVEHGHVAAVSFLPAAPVTAVASTVATSLFTKIAHGLTNGMAVVPTGFVNTTGITNGGVYFVVGVTANTFQLAATVGGAAITLGGTADTNITITGATLVTLIPNADYTIANATLTAPRYSYAANPQGFPTWFNWTPTLAGWSANPTNTVYRYCVTGTQIVLVIRQATTGTSNSATHTATLPVAAATITNMAWQNQGKANDNGTVQLGALVVASAGTTVSLQGIFATATNTNSGNSAFLQGQVTYEF